MTVLKAPIKWFGGKQPHLARLLRFIPKRHKSFIEVFGGGACVLIAKEPAALDVYNDLDSRLVNFYRVLRDPDQFKEFQRQANLVPYSREESEDAALRGYGNDPVENALTFFIIMRMSYSASSTGWSRDTHNRQCSSLAYISAVDRLFEVHTRLRTVQIEKLSFQQVLEDYDYPEALFYLDPPYLQETRKSGSYEIEMISSQHAVLCNRLRRLKGMAFLSGYINQTYKILEDTGWARVDFRTISWSVGCSKDTGVKGEGSKIEDHARTESVWINPALKRRLWREGRWNTAVREGRLSVPGEHITSDL